MPSSGKSSITNRHPMKPRIEMLAKIAVVIGASGGIGQAIAIDFAKRGWKVVPHGCRNVARLSETIEKIRTHTKPELCQSALVSDIADVESNRSLVDAVFDRYQRVDAWVNAAGADVLTGINRDLSFSQKVTRLWETDVHGTMMLSRFVASRMVSADNIGTQPPSIIHLGWDQSDHGMEGDSGQYFAAVKSAVSAFSKSLALSLAPHVRVNCVAPGWIQTSWGNAASKNWNERAIGESMLHRWGTPEDVAHVVVSLCSEDGAFINGQTIQVNGGWKPMELSVRSETDLRH